jgi:hypothetical protein
VTCAAGTEKVGVFDSRNRTPPETARYGLSIDCGRKK